jgi:hypothetical protein
MGFSFCQQKSFEKNFSIILIITGNLEHRAIHRKQFIDSYSSNGIFHEILTILMKSWFFFRFLTKFYRKHHLFTAKINWFRMIFFQLSLLFEILLKMKKFPLLLKCDFILLCLHKKGPMMVFVTSYWLLVENISNFQ